MNEPTRYTAAGNGVVRTDSEGLLIAYGHYQELQAENARLKAEVERLTKAGDLMCRMAGNNQVINRHWKTAKKGVQS